MDVRAMQIQARGETRPIAHRKKFAEGAYIALRA